MRVSFQARCGSVVSEFPVLHNILTGPYSFFIQQIEASKYEIEIFRFRIIGRCSYADFPRILNCSNSAFSLEIAFK